MTEPATAAPQSGNRPTWLTRNVKVLCGVSFLQDAASELLYPILPIFLTTVLGAPPAAVGAIEGLAEGAASITKVAAGRLADRFSRRPLIGTGYGLAALGKCSSHSPPPGRSCSSPASPTGSAKACAGHPATPC